MDDTAQNIKNPIVQPNPSQPVSAADQKINVQQQVTKVVPISSSMNKEVGGASEVVRRSEEELKLDAEIEKAGVKPSEPEVPEHKDVGMTPSAESVKPNLEPTGTVTVITQDEAKKIVKKERVSLGIREQGESIYFIASVYGLASIILKNFKKMHTKIKNKLK